MLTSLILSLFYTRTEVFIIKRPALSAVAVCVFPLLLLRRPPRHTAQDPPLPPYPSLSAQEERHSFGESLIHEFPFQSWGWLGIFLLLLPDIEGGRVDPFPKSQAHSQSCSVLPIPPVTHRYLKHDIAKGEC